MTKLLFIGIIAFFASGCRNKDTPTFKRNERLISTTSELIYDMDEMTKLPEKKFEVIFSNKFNQLTDTVKYLNNRIYISCLMTEPGCAHYTGNVRFQKDTLFLEAVKTVNVECTEETMWRMTYEVLNPSNRHYILLKR